MTPSYVFRTVSGANRRDARKAVVAWCHWAVAHKSEFHWQEVRPYVLSNNGPFVFDCSSSTEWIFWRAGARDPVRSNYNGWANSDLQWARGRHIPTRSMVGGDCMVFGVNGSVHIAICCESWTHSKGNPLMFNMGSTSDPSFQHLSDYNSGPFVIQQALRFPMRTRRSIYPAS